MLAIKPWTTLLLGGLGLATLAAEEPAFLQENTGLTLQAEPAPEELATAAAGDDINPEWETFEPVEEPTPEMRLALFDAVIADQPDAISDLLERGVRPDTTLTPDAARELATRLDNRMLAGLLTADEGVTALMVASGLGRAESVRTLLAAGARTSAKTRRHKTFALWLAGRYGCPEVMQELMKIPPDSEVRAMKIEIDIARQQARLLKYGQEIFSSPISSGRRTHPTPTGIFVVTDKYEDWRSTIYRARMPHYMRLSCRDFGLHAGALPGYPASHGCVRLPAAKARELFTLTPPGVVVEIR